MEIKTNIAGWRISKVLVDSGSSADIIFANAFNQMKLSRTQLQPSDSPLIGFEGKQIDALGKNITSSILQRLGECKDRIHHL
jgi:hypothetical protein